MSDDATRPEENQREILAGASAEYKAQMKIASMLEDALASIRAYARTHDYFVGYSLAEVIDDKLNVIGSDDSKDEDSDAFIPGTIATRTKISQVNYIWGLLLGTDEGASAESGGAIGLAANAENVSDLAVTEDNEDSGAV